jgi:hypothetical protein
MNTISKAACEGDIVSRLRNWRGLHLAHSGTLFEQAADEIERLRNGATEGRETVQQEPAAWLAFATDGSESSAVYLLREQAEAAASEWGWFVLPLYRHPQPTLTAEEREAIHRAEARLRTAYVPDDATAATLRAMLERTK